MAGWAQISEDTHNSSQLINNKLVNNSQLGAEDKDCYQLYITEAKPFINYQTAKTLANTSKISKFDSMSALLELNKM